MKNKQRIRNLLEKGKRLTVLSVLNKIGTIELRVYISKLRREGLDIKGDWTKRNGKNFKIYYIAK